MLKQPPMNCLLPLVFCLAVSPLLAVAPEKRVLWDQGNFRQYDRQNGAADWGDSIADQTGSLGTGTDTPHMADINGDGLDDMVVVRPEGGGWTAYARYTEPDGSLPSTGIGSQASGFSSSIDRIHFGDFNGDGIDDTIAIRYEHANMEWLTRLSNGAGLDWGVAPVSAMWGTKATDIGFPADINGDGYTDKVLVRPYSGDPTKLELLVDYSNASGWGDGSADDTAVVNGSQSTDNVAFSDINSDGLDDVVLIRDIGLSFMLFGYYSTTEGGLSDSPADISTVGGAPATNRWLFAQLFVDPSSIEGTLLTVKDFGAIGDGVADDTAAIQQAIDTTALAYLPYGQYRTTGPITLPANSTVTGSGVIYADFDSGNAVANMALYVDGDNVKISAIGIEKGFLDGSYASGIIVSSGHKNISIKDVEISGYSVRHGIHIIECSEFTISGCYIHDFMMNAGGANAPDMIEDSPAGIRITRSEHGTIFNNRIMRIEVGADARISTSERVPAYGPQGYRSRHIAVLDSRFVSIVGNVMATSGAGIDMEQSTHCTVQGNVVHDIYAQGLKLPGLQYSSLAANAVDVSYQGVVLAHHDAAGQSCRGNVVATNVILDSGAWGSFGEPERLHPDQAYGIELQDSVDRNIIALNCVFDTESAAYMSAAVREGNSTHNIYDHNWRNVPDRCDFNGNGRVNSWDLLILASSWMTPTGDQELLETLDVSNPPDQIINLFDFAVFANSWLNADTYASPH